MKYEAVICFETHVALNTRTKLFCDCPVEYGAHPNTYICPVCTGQPGVLPVLNKKAVEYCIRAGLALNCSVNQRSGFARKNYFYPDLPKGYQITQYEFPVCENGYLEISDGDNTLPVGIKRIHLEEDAGKMVHTLDDTDSAEHSYVDYNRSGIPLLEIVADHTRSPIQTLDQAHTYLTTLQQILRYIGISDCSIEKGQFRCDVNVSLRPWDSKHFDNRAEIKNMTSFKFIMKAVEYEIRRQTQILDAGKQVEQETRWFDEDQKITRLLRTKEDAPDYRYFPEPDLLDIEVDQDFIVHIQDTLPELPDKKQTRFIDQYHITQDEAILLTKDKDISKFFEACVPRSKDLKKLIRWIIKDLFTLLNETSQKIKDSGLSPENFAELLNLISQGDITEKVGRSVLKEIFETGESPLIIIERNNLGTIRDTDYLEKICKKVITDNQKVAEKIKKGDIKPLNFLVGQVMRKTSGKANPQMVSKLILEELSTV
ncbi:MAG: Asp-tRNA(Asn)/Glu-tRNA(Gln) amidotransferase subunit GatB [bacterium]